MGLRINQNIAAQNAYRNLSVTDGQMAKSLEKLSSGFRINRAADDAAGLSISEGLRSQVGGLKVASRNAQDGISVVQTAEGALSEVHSILQRMRDLAVQASNSGSQDTDARTAAQTEIGQLKQELNRIGSTTSFGNTKLLDGTYGVQNAQTGATQTATAGAFTPITVAASTTFSVDTASLPSATVSLQAGTYNSAAEMQTEVNRALRAGLVAQGGNGDEVQASYSTADNGDVTFKLVGTETFTTTAGATDGLAEFGVTAGASAATGTGGTFQVGANNSANDRISVQVSKVSTTDLSVGTVDVTTEAGAQAAIDTVGAAIRTVSTNRARLGAVQNRLEHTIANLAVSEENLAASESRIRDTDMAQEMVSFTRAQILTQAGTAMLAQANQAPQSVLSLLR